MYFSIIHQADKETGIYPQAQSMTLMHAHQISYHKFASFIPKLVFNLHKKAHLTDVLSQTAISANGLLISEQLKILLEGFHIMQHRWYPVLLHAKKEQLPYFWLHLVDHFENKIDYSKSVFYWTKSTFRKGNLSLSSYEDYLEKKKEHGHLWGVGIDKISLTKEFDPQLDLFSCLPFDMGIYASEKLVHCLRENDITGIEMKEAIQFI